MSDPLEDQLRKAFAAEQSIPQEGHEARFALRLSQSPPAKGKTMAKRLYWAAAAALAGAVLWWALPHTDAPTERLAADTNPAVRAAEHQFAENTTMPLVSASAQDPVVMDLMQRLSDLEKEYERLGPALLAAPDKPELVEAALSNLRYRTDVMLRLRQYLQIKTLENNNENEKNSHS